jgi:replicative DNA helicase
MANSNYIDNFLDRLDSDQQMQLKDKLNQPGYMPDVLYNAYKNEATALTMMSEWVDEAQELVDNFGKIIGLRTGYDTLDDLTKGLKGGDLIVLAGQPSHGKTLVGNNIAYRMAKNGDPVLFITLEMTKAKVTARMMQIARQDGTDPMALPIYYQQMDWVSANDIPKLIQKAMEEAGVKTVIIDHLHFMADRDARDMRMEIGKITQSMKRVAVKHNIPIILLAQVKRLEDENKRPKSSDLKETGYIEQDADIIIMIWRNISVDSVDPNAVEIYCTKNRDNGFTSDRVKHLYQQGATLREPGDGEQQIIDPFDH